MSDIKFENGIYKQKITSIRKAISKAMKNAKTVIPETTLMVDIDVTNLVKLRKELKDKYEAEGVKLTFLPFITKAVVSALSTNPIVNSRFDEANEEITFFENKNIAFAVDTPRGLFVPVMHKVEEKSLKEIALSISDLAKKAADGKLTMPEITNSTFTISNYGSVGIKYATPVINWPNVAIVGVGAFEERHKHDENNKPIVQTILPLSLTIDHRIIDGGDGARFLKDIRTILESTDNLNKLI